MLDPLAAAIKVAGAGLEVQSARLRVVAENMANANVNGPTPGSDPYARKTITFESELDEATGANLVRVAGSEPTSSPSGSNMIQAIPRPMPVVSSNCRM